MERFGILTVETISTNKSGARFVRQNLFRYDFLYIKLFIVKFRYNILIVLRTILYNHYLPCTRLWVYSLQYYKFSSKYI